MLEQLEQNEIMGFPAERRSNPFIRTRQRRNFDRREAYRAGVEVLTFVQGDTDHVTVSLKNISDSGACLEIPNDGLKGYMFFHLGIPLLHNKTIACETTWKKRARGSGQFNCGVRFIGLTSYEKTQLRKQVLLNEQIFLNHAETIAAKTDSAQKKEDIRAFFFVDLRMAMERLIDIDVSLPENIQSDGIADHCKETLDTLVEAGDELDAALQDVALTKEIKNHVRALLGQFLYQSQVMKRAVEKPRGYPGDYKMLEMAYNNKELSSGIGRHFDRYALDHPYSEAIRMRKDMMRDVLSHYINTSTRHNLRILNLASGAVREIREMLQSPVRHNGRVEIMCVDQDEEAIQYSKEQLQNINNAPIAVNFIQGNILRLEDLDIGPDNSIDMIYSIGIADYLQDRMLTKIFHDSYKKLRPGGKLVVAYKDREKNKPLAFNWYGDWNFIPRNEPELKAIINNALVQENFSVNISWEPTGVIFFAEIIKNC